MNGPNQHGPHSGEDDPIFKGYKSNSKKRKFSEIDGNLADNQKVSLNNYFVSFTDFSYYYSRHQKPVDPATHLPMMGCTTLQHPEPIKYQPSSRGRQSASRLTQLSYEKDLEPTGVLSA
jgi:hypothetical protein